MAGQEGFVTDDLGDVRALIENGVEVSVDPTTWGWLTKGGTNDAGDWRCSVESLRDQPFVELLHVESCEPQRVGPKGSGHVPAIVESAGGTLANFDRLSEAAGHAARRLSRSATDDTLHISDFVAGRVFTVRVQPPRATSPGAGTVYLLDCITAVKIGFTSGSVAGRIKGIQTGNPHRVVPMAEIRESRPALEALMHERLGHDRLEGEWFDRHAIERTVGARGLRSWLRNDFDLPADRIFVYPDYEKFGTHASLTEETR